MRALRYSLEEAAASLWRGRQGGLLSTATIALALFVLGAFLLVTVNLNRLGAEWSRAAELSVYVKDDAGAAERVEIERALAPGAVVASREHVSKAEALVRFKRTFGDLASAIEGAGENPLPESYEVRLQPREASSAAIDRLGTALRQMAGVADVRYDRDWVDRLMAGVAILRGIGLVLGIVLTLAAALTVANVVRLAFYARRDELEIMELVGAPRTYIRGPFIAEGVLQGGIGAVAALAALGAGFWLVRARYLAPLASAVNLSAIHFLPVELVVALVGGGMAVGCVGGIVAAANRGAAES